MLGVGQQACGLVFQKGIICNFFHAAMEAIKMREGLRIAMAVSRTGNTFFQVCTVM
jgi:hypothetical protein